MKFILIVIINMIIGSFVLYMIDNKEGDLFKWYKRCPFPIIGCPLILTCWPIILYFKWRFNK